MSKAPSFPQVTTLSKRSLGRPLGSKNKAKPDHISDPKPNNVSRKPMIVNVLAGGDVMEYIVNVARRGHISMIVLSANDTLSRVMLNNTLCSERAVELHGLITVISLNDSYISLQSGVSPPSLTSSRINLCTSMGQVFGGAVHHRIVADTNNIQLVISTFNNPFIYKQVPQPPRN